MEKETQQAGEKTLWHYAFFEAMQQELFDYRDSLEFKKEHPLTTEALRVDLLIIKKQKDVIIDKNIARIFRADNLIEYKSPDDYLSVNDFLKVNAYANLYAAITHGVDFAEMSLTFIESRHPYKLLRYLTETRGYMVEETSPGIYLVTGDYLPIQIIESTKLSEQENLWLKSLMKGLQGSKVDSILDEAEKRGTKAFLGAYLYVLFMANPKAFLEVKNMERMRETFEEVFTKNGFIPELIERGRVQGMEEGRVQGMEEGRVQGMEEGRVQGMEEGRVQGMEEGRVQGMEEGRVQGMEEGLERGIEVVARNAIVNGLPVEVIHTITGLDIETINQLAAAV